MLKKNIHFYTKYPKLYSCNLIIVVKESKYSIVDPNACLLKVTDNDEKINREFLCDYSNSKDCNQYKIVNFNNRLVENKPNIYESYYINKNSLSNDKNISDNVIASIV